MKRKLAVFEVDDYPRGYIACIEYLDKLKALNPQFCATVFAIYSELDFASMALLRDRKDWLKVGIHTWSHRKDECRGNDYSVTAKMLQKCLEKYHRTAKIVKARGYSYSTEFIEHASKLGYTISIRHLNDLAGKRMLFGTKITTQKQILENPNGKVRVSMIGAGAKWFHCHTVDDDWNKDVTRLKLRMSYYWQQIPLYDFAYSIDLGKWL